jgi:hypothetical protein
MKRSGGVFDWLWQQATDLQQNYRLGPWGLINMSKLKVQALQRSAIKHI